jgi:hypothetical protein
MIFVGMAGHLRCIGQLQGFNSLASDILQCFPTMFFLTYVDKDVACMYDCIVCLFFLVFFFFHLLNSKFSHITIYVALT